MLGDCICPPMKLEDVPKTLGGSKPTVPIEDEFHRLLRARREAEKQAREAAALSSTKALSSPKPSDNEEKIMKTPPISTPSLHIVALPRSPPPPPEDSGTPKRNIDMIVDNARKEMVETMQMLAKASPAKPIVYSEPQVLFNFNTPPRKRLEAIPKPPPINNVSFTPPTTAESSTPKGWMCPTFLCNNYQWQERIPNSAGNCPLCRAERPEVVPMSPAMVRIRENPPYL